MFSKVYDRLKKYILVYDFEKITYWYILVCTGMMDMPSVGRGREVKAGMPCSSGVGQRGFDPANPNAQNVPSFSTYQFDMNPSPFL